MPIAVSPPQPTPQAHPISQLHSLTGHLEEVLGTAFSPDSQTVVSARIDGIGKGRTHTRRLRINGNQMHQRYPNRVDHDNTPPPAQPVPTKRHIPTTVIQDRDSPLTAQDHSENYRVTDHPRIGTPDHPARRD